MRGTLVAPAAEVALPAGDKSHLGAVFARSLRVADGAVIDHRAFEGADVDYAAAPDYHQCVTQCQTVYMTNTAQCGNTYTTNISACDSQYWSCSAGSAVSCAGAAAAGPAAYAACMIATIANTCQIAARNCYATSAPPFQTCINQQNQARTTCNTTCR